MTILRHVVLLKVKVFVTATMHIVLRFSLPGHHEYSYRVYGSNEDS